MNGAEIIPPAAWPGAYIPGYGRCKLLMVLFGLLLFFAGMSQLIGPLGLVLFGNKATGEATVVVKAREGFPDSVLKDDLEVQAGLESRDRSYVFWNRFRFHTPDGETVDVRAPVGSQLKPIYPLRDEEGLPTTDLIYYDAAQPERVVFPLIVSTWFAPGMLVFIGLLCATVGGVLHYWADKPIELPHIPGGEAKDK